MKLTPRTQLLSAVFAGLIAASAAQPAAAAPLLGIELQQTGYATYSQTGGSPLIVAQSEGTFSTNVEVNTLNLAPLSIDLGSTNITASGPGTLTVIASINGLTSPIGLGGFLSQLTGHMVSGSGTITMSSYIDDSNTLCGTATPLSTLTPGNSALANANTSAPFAITEVFTITALSAGAEFSIDGSTTSVPEPASLALLSSALIGIGALRGRRRQPA